MKSIGISDDLPEYLQSKYSVFNPHRRASTASKTFRSELRQGVSEESPKHFKVNHVPILNPSMKNEAIAKDSNSTRFMSNLKKNFPINKPAFDYSEIKSQKFDFDTLKFTEGLDVKAGNSARIQRAMAYSDQYNKTLKDGFGIRRGDFIVELSQTKAPRYEYSQLLHLEQFLNSASHKKTATASSKRSKSFNFEALTQVYAKCPRNVNTPNRKLRKRRPKEVKTVSLVELDVFDADIKSRQSLWKSTLTYKDYLNKDF